MPGAVGRRGLGVLLLAALIAGLVVQRDSAPPPAPGQPPAPPSRLTPADLATFRALIAADRHAVRPTSEGLVARYPEQGLRFAFTDDGLAVQGEASGWEWAVRAVRLERGPAQTTLPAASPEPEGDSVRYARGPVTEWYVPRADGLEQGFTVAVPPAANDPASAAPLRLVLAVASGLTGAAESATGLVWQDAAGAAVLAYRGLRAWDAAGRALDAWVELEADRLALAVADAGAVYPLTIDPLVQQAKLTANDGAAGDFFGWSVALSGNTAVVGAFAADPGNVADQGAAYVFVRSGSTWTQEAKLVVEGGAANDNLGYSVAVSGNTAVVGAPNTRVASQSARGAAYVFVRGPSMWEYQATLLASDGAADHRFGTTVAVAGDVAVVGAPRAGPGALLDRGAAYVFTRSGSSWTEQQKLTPSDQMAGDQFGNSVALSGDTIVAGSLLADVAGNADQGKAYVFV